MSKTHILTHRGLQPSTLDFYPESSYEAFQDQLTNGFGIEFDPNFVRDGIVASHDATLKRITNEKDIRDFHDVTIADVISLRYRTKNGDELPTKEGRIPTLEEILELIGRSSANIHALHLKGKFQEPKMLDQLIAVL